MSFLRWMNGVREILASVEQLKAERNSASKAIGQLKKAGEDAAEKMQAVRDIGERIKTMDEEVRTVQNELQEAVAWHSQYSACIGAEGRE